MRRHVPTLIAVLAAVALTLIADRAWRKPASDAFPGEARLREAWMRIRESAVEDPDSERLAEGAVAGMVAAADPWAEAMGPAEWELFRRRAAGVSTGVGIELFAAAGAVRVAAVAADGSAARAGVRPLDTVVAVDGRTPTDDVDAAAAFDGPEGSKVELVVGDGGGMNRRVLALERRAADRRVVTARNVDGALWVHVAEFRPTTPAQWDAAVDPAAVRAGRGLVVDLRGNRGGDLAAAVTLADAWLDGGVVYRRRTRDDAGTVSATAGAPLGGVPTILLVDRDTASAAEVLAGALADAGHATLVGERTFGKGAVQEVIAFETAPGGMKLTTALLATPSGRALEARPGGFAPPTGGTGRGLVPDVVVPMDGAARAALRRTRLRARSAPETVAYLVALDGSEVPDPALSKALALLPPVSPR